MSSIQNRYDVYQIYVVLMRICHPLSCACSCNFLCVKLVYEKCYGKFSALQAKFQSDVVKSSVELPRFLTQMAAHMGHKEFISSCK